MFEVIGYVVMIVSVLLLAFLTYQRFSKQGNPRVWFATLGALFISGGMLTVSAEQTLVSITLAGVAVVTGIGLIYWRSLRLKA